MSDTSAESLRVLVVDDERLARTRLTKLLEAESDVGSVETAPSGDEAVELIRSASETRRPIDIVFLDVHMPGMSGLDVVREIGPDAMPVTIFVTAYDQHALAAFELAALDYLLKPFENERFRSTLERAREFVRLKKVETLHARLRALLEGPGRVGTAPRRPKEGYFERIAVEMRGRVRVVPVGDVAYVTAEGNYVRLHAGDETYLIGDTMNSLEERLDPERFVRIHRSTIVRLDQVESLLTAPGGDYSVRLKDGTRLKVARSRRDHLAEQLGIR